MICVHSDNIELVFHGDAISSPTQGVVMTAMEGTNRWLLKIDDQRNDPMPHTLLPPQSISEVRVMGKCNMKFDHIDNGRQTTWLTTETEVLFMMFHPRARFRNFPSHAAKTLVIHTARYSQKVSLCKSVQFDTMRVRGPGRVCGVQLGCAPTRAITTRVFSTSNGGQIVVHTSGQPRNPTGLSILNTVLAGLLDTNSNLLSTVARDGDDDDDDDNSMGILRVKMNQRVERLRILQMIKGYLTTSNVDHRRWLINRHEDLFDMVSAPDIDTLVAEATTALHLIAPARQVVADLPLGDTDTQQTTCTICVDRRAIHDICEKCTDPVVVCETCLDHLVLVQSSEQAARQCPQCRQPLRCPVRALTS